MSSQTVYNKKELKQALKNGTEEIIICGDFADTVKKALKVKKYGPKAIAILAASIPLAIAAPIAAPIASPLYVAALEPVAAEAGVALPIVVAVTIIGGLSIVLAILNEYEVIEIKAGFIKIHLKRSK